MGEDKNDEWGMNEDKNKMGNEERVKTKIMRNE